MNNEAIIEGVDITDFCSGSGCKQFIVWDFGYGDCYSCKLVGQSHVVDVAPYNCEKAKELREWL